MRRLLFVGLLATGCATAGTEQPSTGTDAAMIDGSTADAAPDAPLPCNEVTTELLKNPALDATPMGTMWMQTPIDIAFPLITDDGAQGGPGIAEHSAPFQAWLGGLPAAGASTTDVLWQDIAIPARTRLLIFSGFYEVKSGDPATTAVDTCSVAWVDTNNSPIATIIALDNTKKTTVFTTLNYSLSNAPMFSGMTIRLRLTSTNNPQLAPPPANTGATSCFFDTLSVKATHCMP